jgi:short-subunit dehydrogenase
MAVRLKRIEDQVVVITGASSGIGLATARLAAERGAAVVLSSRNQAELESIAAEIERGGGRALAVAADVADPEAVQHVADEAIRRFGGFDTWVNDAGVSIYGRLIETPLEEKRRLFDVNYWGVVHGCRAAVPHLQVRGGAIVNVGSVVSDRAVPLQGAYSASKHAVKGYTDALRMELEADGAPISVTLVKPAGIDTPFFAHAENHMQHEAKPPPPVYAPRVVARAILECAERPVREITVGGGGRLLTALGLVAPRLTDLYMERLLFSAQQSDRPPTPASSLREAGDDGREDGGYEGHVMRSSAYTSAMLSDVARALPVLALGAGLAAHLLRGRAAMAGAARVLRSPALAAGLTGAARVLRPRS